MATTQEMLQILKQAGFDDSFRDIVQVFAGGSDQHGTKVPGKGDLDVFGVYIEPPIKVIGLGRDEHFTSGTANQYERNKEDDQDYKLYSLRRWAGLAAKGNPTILGFLFSPTSHPNSPWAKHIATNPSLFVASSNAYAFLGYGKSQYHRMVGEKGKGKHGQRPELEQQFGYDTKAAMHMIRLMHEGIELMTSGVITYPRPEREELLQIRLGEWSQTKIQNEYLRLENDLKQAEATSKLPKIVDRQAISELLVTIYMTHWTETNQINKLLNSILNQLHNPKSYTTYIDNYTI